MGASWKYDQVISSDKKQIRVANDSNIVVGKSGPSQLEPFKQGAAQVFSLFASKEGYSEATALMQTFTAEQFAELDKKVVETASLVTSSGGWTDKKSGRILYDELLATNGKAVKISLCQQLLAHPQLQTSIVLLGIKIGISRSENELVGILFVYENKSMAADFLNSGLNILKDGGLFAGMES